LTNNNKLIKSQTLLRILLMKSNRNNKRKRKDLLKKNWNKKN